MDRSRKATRQRNEATLQHKSRNETLLLDELVESQLAELQASVQRMERTPEGTVDLQRRIKAFGECLRSPDETSGQYCDKLRHWLNRAIPQTKLPLHPPRQFERIMPPKTEPSTPRKTKAMSMKAGVWIDHKQAVAVLLTAARQQIKKVKFDTGSAVTATGTRANPKHTPNDFIAEDRRERKVEADRQSYYDDVIACIQGADSLLILGPGEAKGELSKRIKAKKVRGIAVVMETADKMTDRQLAAAVQKHFAAGTSKKVVAPKKAAPKAGGATTKKSLRKARS